MVAVYVVARRHSLHSNRRFSLLLGPVLLIALTVHFYVSQGPGRVRVAGFRDSPFFFWPVFLVGALGSLLLVIRLLIAAGVLPSVVAFRSRGATVLTTIGGMVLGRHCRLHKDRGPVSIDCHGVRHRYARGEAPDAYAWVFAQDHAEVKFELPGPIESPEAEQVSEFLRKRGFVAQARPHTE